MTDIALLLAITVCLTSFWKAYASNDKAFHGHLFFVGLAMGMLVKGPVALVLVGFSLVVWAFWSRSLFRAIGCLPWVTGGLLFLTITIPWYVLAEHRTPGFLHYFIVGEHFYRFVIPGWEGDLYGNAHDQRRGMIWLFWVITAFPWSFLLLSKLLSLTAYSASLRYWRNKATPTDSTSYLVSWMLAPLLLFTLSGNILMAYTLPGFSALALIIGCHWQLDRKTIAYSGIALLLLLTIPFIYASGLIKKTSEIELLGENPAKYANFPLFYYQKRPFSASFYSRGQAIEMDDTQQLFNSLSSSKGAYLVAENKHYHLFVPKFSRFCEERARTKDRFLLFCQVKQ
jgi:4-amino-4-deoxy-L-arabinose transferase-like glycosyltransferase